MPSDKKLEPVSFSPSEECGSLCDRSCLRQGSPSVGTQQTEQAGRAEGEKDGLLHPGLGQLRGAITEQK